MSAPIISAIGFNVSSADGSVAGLEPGLRHHAEIGTEAIEIAVSSLDMVAGGRVVPDRVAALERLTRAFPFAYTVHGLVSSNFMDSATRDRQVAAAAAMLEICDRIGAKILVQHSGEVRADHPLDVAGAVTRERDALASLARVAEPLGIRVALENIFTTEPGQFRLTPSEVAATVRAIDHPNVVALIDIGHAYIEATYRGLDFRAELRAIAPVAGHLHVHDNFGQPAGLTPFYFPAEATALGLGDLHLPLGWGDIPWDEVATDLAAVRPGTVLMMEIGRRYRLDHAACLAEARRIAGLMSRSRPAG